MIFLAALFVSAGAVAQQNLPVYTLRQCLEVGLENNYSVRLVKVDEKISEENATKGNAGLLPTVDLTGSYGGDFGSTRTESRATGDITREQNAYDQSVNLGVNASYLSTLFKKETGKTLTEYVNGKRIEYAIFLLNSTQLQIQAIAQYCGISDVNYFTRLFKTAVGKTPKEYRDSIYI